MKQFKAESKRLMDLMVNSIYTNKEIFLRELISNASDALDKLHFKSLTETVEDTDFKIEIRPDRALRTLTISDNGVGMTKDELENNLGTIAASGTFKFKQENTLDENVIGQFGVGFYSAFMVSSKVEVVSRAFGSDEAYLWTSSGADGYDIKKSEKAAVGTTVTLYIKENDEDVRYDEFLSEYKIKELVKKYSDYIRYPIVMETHKHKPKEGDDKEYVEYTDLETLNDMQPIWRRPKAKVKKKEYEDFYTAKFHDYREPAHVILANIEGAVNYTALLFVPFHAPMDYYSREYRKGLQLYSNGVLIMDRCPDLLPDWFGFIKGVIDSPDLSLNISREILQQDRQLKAIANSLEKKIISELNKLLKKDRELYEKIFAEFGASIKYGVYDRFGEKKDALKDLLLFYSSLEKNRVTLAEYVSRMKEGQADIYYACAADVKRADSLPQTEHVKAKGWEILYLTDNIDEFAVKMLGEYDGKKFKNVSGIGDENAADELKKNAADAEEANKELLAAVKERLSGRASAVKFSSKLVSSPVALSSEGEISLEMEKVLKSLNGNEEIKAKRVLELNPSHSAVERLKTYFSGDREKFDALIDTLYDLAVLTEGLPIDDVAALTANISKLI